MTEQALVEAVHQALRESSSTLATAESLTGGALAGAITAQAGASQIYLGGVVSYATAVKVGVLGVSPEIVEEHGVISARCAHAMARGVRDLTGATYALSTTGVAGPDSQEGRAAGSVFLALDGPDGVDGVELALSGSRGDIVRGAVQAALQLLLRSIRPEQIHLG